MPVLEGGAIARLVSDGTATAGMIAKLRACEQALAGGVEDVVIVDGRDGTTLIAAAGHETPARATRLRPDPKPDPGRWSPSNSRAGPRPCAFEE